MINIKEYADEILDNIDGYGKLVVISVGENAASESYIKGKKKDCERVGFECLHIKFDENVPQHMIASVIETYNYDDSVTGIIVQLPLPEKYNSEYLTNLIIPEKDVDGFRADSKFSPCTPEGVLYVLHKELGDLTGKEITLIGRGQLVGKPLINMLLAENATLTVCHSHTSDIIIHTINADATIVATGHPHTLTDKNTLFPEYSILIDCGVNRDENGKLCGDCDPNLVDKQTPVPGGMGLMTRAMLMKHVERKIK